MVPGYEGCVACLGAAFVDGVMGSGLGVLFKLLGFDFVFVFRLRGRMCASILRFFCCFCLCCLEFWL